MFDSEKMKFEVSFMGGKQAGCVGLLSLYAIDCKVISIVAYDYSVKKLAEVLKIPVFSSIKEKKFLEYLKKSDLLVSCHGREIVPADILKMPRICCINAHPNLYKHKGSNPIERLLENGDTKASVGVHYMSEKVDVGKTIVEKIVDISGKNTVAEVYNELYPYYSYVIIEAINRIYHTTQLSANGKIDTIHKI